jgi:hypothetical protein
MTFFHLPARLFALGLIAITVTLTWAATASANWYYTPAGGARLAKDYVSRTYENTYYSDLSASCHAQGMKTRPGYKYHRLICNWYDHSDGTSGTVGIIGSQTGPGAYYGREIVAPH